MTRGHGSWNNPTYPTSSYIENTVLYEWFDELMELKKLH